MGGSPTIMTISGIDFPLLEPETSDIRPLDIAHGLSNICRFNGQSRVRYTVADHSLLVLELVRERRADRTEQLWALLHDAPEAYIGDLTKPLKSVLPEFEKIEDRIMWVICERFSLPVLMPEVVKWADKQAVAIEGDRLMNCRKGSYGPVEAETPFLGPFIDPCERFLHALRHLHDE